MRRRARALISLVIVAGVAILLRVLAGDALASRPFLDGLIDGTLIYFILSAVNAVAGDGP